MNRHLYRVWLPVYRYLHGERGNQYKAVTSLTHFLFKPLISISRRSNILAIISLFYFVFVDIFCVKLDRSIYVIIPENNIYRRCLSARRLTEKTNHRKDVIGFFQIPVVGFSFQNRRCRHFHYFLLIIQYERNGITVTSTHRILAFHIQFVKESRTIEKKEFASFSSILFQNGIGTHSRVSHFFFFFFFFFFT